MAASASQASDSINQGAAMALYEPNSAQDFANRAFEAFSKSQFKETQKYLDKIVTTAGGSQEKDHKVQMNSLLNEYYMNKGKNPQKLLSELISLTQNMVEITKAPTCQIRQTGDGQQQSVTIQLGTVYTGPINPSGISASSEQLQATGSASHRSASQNPKQAQAASSAFGGVSDIVPSSSGMHGSLVQSSGQEVNTILLYNIAALSYQMQQYGQSLSYLIELMKKLDQAEEFIVLKGMFLLLQVLFELRQSSAAWPVIAFIEIKFKEAEKMVQQKKEMKSNPPHSISESPIEESKSDQGAASGQWEVLDETVLTKNSFSIINASYIRRHAVSPKNMNIHEYKILLSSYKAMFLLIQNDIQQAHKEIKIATELRAKINQDPVKIKQNINEASQIQHQGLVNNIKALIHLGQGDIMKSINNLSFDEKDYPKVHPSCYHNKHNDEHSKHDQTYQKCLSNHPQYYFNNLGVIHLKLHKYNLAIFYFSKALKFLEKSQNGQIQQPYDTKESPLDYISNLSSQKTPEILYNYGLALFKSSRFEEAFRCFEKASSTLKHHPRLWYYMGMSVLNFNMKKQQDMLSQEYQSDVYDRMVSWGTPNYTKILSNNQHRRFFLAMQGDPATKLKEQMTEYEQSQIDKLKQQQMEILKQQQAQSTQKQSKAQQKKEKLAQQAKQSVVSLDSMSLQSAIMYFQNALIAIETTKQNEINYGLYIKFILRHHAISSQQQSLERGALTGSGLTQTQVQSLSDSLNESTDTQSVQGVEEQNSLIYDFPQSSGDLNMYKQQITDRCEKKYLTLKKNVNLHLCYLHLMTYDYSNAIKVGNGILRNLEPNPKTKFQVLQYLAEAYCMLGQTSQAVDCLKGEGASQVDPEIKFKFDNLVNGMTDQSQISAKNISLINLSSVHVCSGLYEQARTCLDQVLDSMDLRLQTTESDSKNLIPSYLINTLVYFFIKTKNYKMARQMLKSRRFLVDVNHIDSVSQSAVSAAAKARNMSKTLVKNFT